jgi:hypothetical protein
VKFTQDIEFVGKVGLTITDANTHGNHPDEGRLCRTTLTCDDILLDGKSVREMDKENEGRFRACETTRRRGWLWLDPEKRLEMPLWFGEFAALAQTAQEEEE